MLLYLVSLEEQLLVLQIELPQQRLVLLCDVRTQGPAHSSGATPLLLLLLLEAWGGEGLGEGAALVSSQRPCS